MYRTRIYMRRDYIFIFSLQDFSGKSFADFMSLFRRNFTIFKRLDYMSCRMLPCTSRYTSCLLKLQISGFKSAVIAGDKASVIGLVRGCYVIYRGLYVVADRKRLNIRHISARHLFISSISCLYTLPEPFTKRAI